MLAVLRGLHGRQCQFGALHYHLGAIELLVNDKAQSPYDRNGTVRLIRVQADCKMTGKKQRRLLYPYNFMFAAQDPFRHKL